jgi:hypothetical protein
MGGDARDGRSFHGLGGEDGEHLRRVSLVGVGGDTSRSPR